MIYKKGIVSYTEIKLLKQNWGLIEHTELQSRGKEEASWRNDKTKTASEANRKLLNNLSTLIESAFCIV